MRPGLPPLEWWKDLPGVNMRIFIFNVTNPEEFLKGDQVLKLKEVGPIVYQERVINTDITFHPENDTMSYTAVHSSEFLEQENIPGILNQTIIVPNLSILAMASRLNNAPFFMKIGFNMLLRRSNDTLFQKTTIYKYLWEMDGNLMKLGEKLVPFMVPLDNYGVLHTMYKDPTDRVNVKIGTASGHENFFKINFFNHRPTVPGYRSERGDCFASIENSTEGSFYPQRLTNQSVLKYWRKTICRPTDLYYKEDLTDQGIPGMKFVLPGNVFDRTEPRDQDCYRGEDESDYPDGLSDASKCYHGFPIVISNPHFLNRTGEWVEKLEGINPQQDIHEGFAIVEPYTGIPLRACARTQSNIFVNKLSGYSNDDLMKFSGMVVPMIWGDICITEIPKLVRWLTFFVVVVVPTLQPIGTALAYIMGPLMIFFAVRRLRKSKIYTPIEIVHHHDDELAKLPKTAKIRLIHIYDLHIINRVIHTQIMRRSIVVFLTIGLILLASGVMSFGVSARDMALDELLRMRPSLPPYNWWKNPPPIIRLRLFIFEATNPVEFLRGDEALKMREIGPIVYREHVVHENITFHPENNTLSFTAVRSVEFLEKENEPGILNKTVIVPNVAILGMASQLADSPFLMKIAFNMLLRKSNDTIFLNTTIYKILWEMDGNLLRLGEKIVPFMVPMDNYGILYTIYKESADRQNVKIGLANGHENFFKINFFNHRQTVPGFYPERGDCSASIVNSTEGLLYPQNLTSESAISYWRKAICRPATLYYSEEVSMGGLYGKKYVLPENSFDRTEPLNKDCYRGKDGSEYPNGLSDASKCYYGFPIVMSKPHFLSRSGKWCNKLDGMNPREEDHGSFIIAEPNTGVPLRECARAQANIFVKKLSGFSNDDLMKFSEMVVPMMWIEYCMLELTPIIKLALRLIVIYLEPLQLITSVVFIAIGFTLLLLVLKYFKPKKYAFIKTDSNMPK
ncbi:scavenger receptor class B member 1 [Sergentomyia squamirostris]